MYQNKRSKQNSKMLTICTLCTAILWIIFSLFISNCCMKNLKDVNTVPLCSISHVPVSVGIHFFVAKVKLELYER